MSGLPEDAVQLIDSPDRALVTELLIGEGTGRSSYSDGAAHL